MNKRLKIVPKFASEAAERLRPGMASIRGAPEVFRGRCRIFGRAPTLI
jgi:hypothetical protein